MTNISAEAGLAIIIRRDLKMVKESSKRSTHWMGRAKQLYYLNENNPFCSSRNNQEDITAGKFPIKDIKK
jgi:hypothetical protein